MDKVIGSGPWIEPPFFSAYPTYAERTSPKKASAKGKPVKLTVTAKYGTGEMSQDVPRSPRAVDATKTVKHSAIDPRGRYNGYGVMGVDGEGVPAYGVGGVGVK